MSRTAQQIRHRQGERVEVRGQRGTIVGLHYIDQFWYTAIFVHLDGTPGPPVAQPSFPRYEVRPLSAIESLGEVAP